MSAAEKVPDQVVEWLAAESAHSGREAAVTRVEEHSDCTVYYWTTAEAAHGSTDVKDQLAGNVPLIIDREGRLWMCGTARPVAFYLADFRGPRLFVRLVKEQR
jgi:hypothetical protein